MACALQRSRAIARTLTPRFAKHRRHAHTPTELTEAEIAARPSEWVRSIPRSSKKGASVNERDELVYHTTPIIDAKPRTRFTFRVRHASPAYIQKAVEVFEEQANKVNLYLKSVVPLPTKIKRWTLLRSPHVDKPSKEQLELRTHKRLITIETNCVAEEQQIVKLQRRLTGMVQNRVTMTMNIPAHTPIHTFTFREQLFENDTIGAEEVAAMEDNESELWEEEDDVMLSEADLIFGEENEWSNPQQAIDASASSSPAPSKIQQ